MRPLRRRRREPLASMAGVVRTEFDIAKLPHARAYEIADLRLQEQSKQEANEVGDFVSNHVQSINDLRSNALKMSLYPLAIRRFTNIPAGMVRIFVDASLEAEMSARAEVERARKALAAASSKKTPAVVFSGSST